MLTGHFQNGITAWDKHEMAELLQLSFDGETLILLAELDNYIHVITLFILIRSHKTHPKNQSHCGFENQSHCGFENQSHCGFENQSHCGFENQPHCGFDTHF